MVKSFDFPLQKVLDIRQIGEDRQAVALKKSQMSFNKEKERLETLGKKKDTHLKTNGENSVDNGSISLNELKVSIDYISQLSDKITNQIKVVEKSNEKMEAERDVLINVSKGKKIVEKLRERQLTDYKTNYRKKESKEESEIALRVILKNKNHGNN
ncbi:MAG TPA: flagellar export protein FliJ [Candidatus Marinimicrobia bacterium]|nr:flagellar export protein FliJ [Candidatus Neomarinimicrobiota bacterium]